MLSAKQQLLNIKHGGGIRPNVCPLTFGPPCTNRLSMEFNEFVNGIERIIPHIPFK